MKQLKFVFGLILSIISIHSFALKPKVIIFDAAGTIINVNRDCYVMFKEVFKQNKWEYTEKVAHMISELAKKDAKVSFISGYLCNNKWLNQNIASYMQICRDLCKNLNYPSTNDNAYDFYHQLYKLAHSPNSPIYSVFPYVKDGLKALKDAGYRLALISNWDSGLRKILKGLEIDEFFEIKIISGELDCQKPDKQIFDITLKELRDLKGLESLEKDDIVYVGDTIGDDILGPIAYGIQPIWVTYGNKGELPKQLKDTVPVAHSFKELLTLFEGIKNFK